MHIYQLDHIIMGFYLVSKDFPSEVFQHRWESFWDDEVLLVPRRHIKRYYELIINNFLLYTSLGRGRRNKCGDILGWRLLHRACGL